MKRIRRTEITVETDEITIVRSSGDFALTLCPECVEVVMMTTPEQAALMCSTNTRVIYRWVEEGRVHHVDLPRGSLLVCPASAERSAKLRSIETVAIENPCLYPRNGK